jgi:threonine/homoserine/homoserine lactone efflux protein
MGGAYLVYLGVALWRQARVPLSEIAGFARGAMADAAAFRGGLFTALSNPKMAAYFGSVFVAVLPPEPPLWFTLVACVSVFLIEFVWYVVVATVFSTAPARRAYGRFKQWIDRVAGGVIAALGVGIMVPGR